MAAEGKFIVGRLEGGATPKKPACSRVSHGGHRGDAIPSKLARSRITTRGRGYRATGPETAHVITQHHAVVSENTARVPLA